MWIEVSQAAQEGRHELVLHGKTVQEKIEKDGIDQNIFQLEKLNFLEIRQAKLSILPETLGINALEIPIKAHIDSNNLYQAIISTKFVEDKRLRLDIAQIQEEVQDQKVQVLWVKSESMLADCLTKRNAKADTLMEVLKTGKMPSQSN